MKKFISMVMAAAMVVSMVPATAFAATGEVDADRAAKVIDAAEFVEDFETAPQSSSLDPVEGLIWGADVPEVSLRLDDVESANGKVKQEIKLKLDGAKFSDTDGIVLEDLEDYSVTDAQVKAMLVGLVEFDGKVIGSTILPSFTLTVDKWTNTSVTYVLEGATAGCAAELKAAIDAGDDTLTFDLQSKMNKTNAGATAKVTLTSDIKGADASDLVYATVEGKGITAELDDEVKDVAPEETVAIDPIEVEPSVGNTFADVLKATEKVKLTLSKGFEFDKTASATVGGVAVTNAMYTDDDEITIDATADIATIRGLAELVISGIEVEAADAKAGDEATLTIKFGGNDAVKIVVAKVVDQGLSISVDEDEDVPVMWSGVDYQNTHLTADADEHVSLEVTIKEAFEESYSDKDEIELTLPEGVYVVTADGVKVTDAEGPNSTGDIKTAFENAYNEGEYKSFIFEKRAFTESEVDVTDAIEFSFELTLVADPGFVGEVPMTMLVDGEEVGTVVIAKFETPLVVEAEQNDLKIDYRNTAVGSDIVVKEAEAGLWKKGMTVELAIEDGTYIDFEDDAVFTVNEDDSDMEIKDSTKDGKLAFTVKTESDDEPAVVTISDMELYMGRSLAAGAYDLVMTDCNAVSEYLADVLFAAEAHTGSCAGLADHKADATTACDKDHNVYDVSDYSDVVKEAFVNIVTAGREQDDASFTTKVVVPVGESYIIAGESTVALDVPAYVSAAGYTMLPVRAVATALGINNNNVMWDQATKTVTILYGQRIITMTVGAKVINVNGSAIPASASVEVVNGRTFLPMRDLATALGVTDITWDAATKTATLNGNI